MPKLKDIIPCDTYRNLILDYALDVVNDCEEQSCDDLDIPFKPFRKNSKAVVEYVLCHDSWFIYLDRLLGIYYVAYDQSGYEDEPKRYQLVAEYRMPE